MAATTGPVLAAAAVRTLTDSFQAGAPQIRYQVVAATVVAAVGLALAERAWPAGARALAWALLLSTLMIQPPGRLSPIEVLLKQIGELPAAKPEKVA